MNENWTEQRYGKMLERIDKIFDADPGTPEGFELDWLVDRVVAYEEKHYPIDMPS